MRSRSRSRISMPAGCARSRRRDHRMSALPDVRAAKETLPNFEGVNWSGRVVRAGTPAAIVSHLNQEVAHAVRDPNVAGRAVSLGLDLIASTPEQFAALQRDESKKGG